MDQLHITGTKDLGEHESFPLIYLEMLRDDHTGHLFFTHRYKVYKVYKGIQLSPYFSLTSTAFVNRRSHGRPQKNHSIPQLYMESQQLNTERVAELSP